MSLVHEFRDTYFAVSCLNRQNQFLIAYVDFYLCISPVFILAITQLLLAFLGGHRALGLPSWDRGLPHQTSSANHEIPASPLYSCSKSCHTILVLKDVASHILTRHLSKFQPITVPIFQKCLKRIIIILNAIQSQPAF